MHIPDGMLDTKTFTTLWVGAGSGIGYASFWIRKHFDQKKIVLMAVLGALVFALQMLNFPIAGGTSGHFSGGALAGMLLGTWPAVIMMSAVLLIQAVFFGDGGITTLGANIVNMAIIAPLVGSVVFHLFNRRQSSPSRQIIGATLGAWLAVVSAALAVSLQLWAAGTAQFFAVLISMLFWHALIGVAEAVVTVSIIIYITRTRPDILADTQPIAQRSSAGPVMVLGVITGLAIGLSWLASSYPDGLEYVFNNNGGTLSGPAVGLFPGLLPGYLTPGIANPLLSRIVASFLGVLLTGLLALAIVSRLTRRPAQPPNQNTLAHVNRALPFAPHTLLLVAVLWIVGIVLGLRNTIWVAPIIFITILLVASSLHAALGKLLLHSLIVLPLALMISLFLPLRFVQSWQLSGILSAYQQAVWLMIGLVLTPWLCLLVMLLLLQVCSQTDLIYALERLHLPRPFLLLLNFGYRYADALREQLRSLHRALIARAPDLSRRRQVLLYGNLGGALLIRSYDRGERIYAAMQARGYDGTLPRLKRQRMRGADGVLLTLTAVFALSLTLL